jgi:glucosamine kinase
MVSGLWYQAFGIRPLAELTPHPRNILLPFCSYNKTTGSTWSNGDVDKDLLLLGVDGGGTRCRARLATNHGIVLAEAVSGPANLRLGLERSFGSVIGAAAQCLRDAALSGSEMSRIVACLALAGASEPDYVAAAEGHEHPFRRIVMTTDAQAACIGAHGGRDGGIIIAGTGTIGWAMVQGNIHRIGGWGLPISDEGSGAWLGTELLRRVLWARDGRVRWTTLLRGVFADFREDPHEILEWAAHAQPSDLGSYAPRIVTLAAERDSAAIELMLVAAEHIDALAARLIDSGADRLSLMGGLAASLRPWLSPATQSHLVEPMGDALTGALALASRVENELTRAA